MKNSVFLGLVAAVGCVGASLGWFINHQKIGKYDAFLGEYDLAGTVTPANIEQHVLLHSDGDIGQVKIEGASTHDFGLMSAGAKGEHVFTITNVGTGPLKLIVGESTCKCTLGELSREVLQPGESADAKVKWVVKTNEDSFGQEAQVITDDPNTPVVRLRVEGKVVRQFDLSPSTITFGGVAYNEPIVGESTIYSFIEGKMDYVEAKVSDPAMNELASIEVRELEKDEYDPKFKKATQGFLVSVHIKPGTPQGAVSQNIAVTFESAAFSNESTPEENTLEQAAANKAAGIDTELEVDKPGQRAVFIPIQGGIVERLRMVTNAKLRAKTGGGYLYLFNRLPGDSVTKATGLVMIKGEDRENLKLKIQNVTPAGVVKATLGEPKSKGSMTLVPVEIEITPGEKDLDFRGLSGDNKDYGLVMIATDKEDGPKMPLYLKFLVEGK